MDFVFEPKAPFFIIDIDSTKEHGMEEIKLDGRCCLSCQNFLVNRTFRNKEGEETIVTEADKGVCSEGAYQGEKVPVLFSCSHYQRWNTIDLELIKNRNQDITPYLYQDEEKEQEETIVENPEDNPLQSWKSEPTEEKFSFFETPDTKKKEKKPSRIGVSVLFGVILVGILFLLLFPTVLQTLAENDKLITIIEFSGTAVLALLILIVVFIRYLKNKPTKK